ncbi:hypothetical protein [Pelobacter seleniigenes]|uniref:hypothetical protein n=1 Tax=Pelobacter seleniigenes TaxID=407188 RepID=UPI0004A72863|nr:hypothetical protein [Pelobacter seleniigenes]
MKRIWMVMLVIGFVMGTTALVSTVAMAHGSGGMMSDVDDVAPCQGESFSGAMHHGYGYGMMGGMMGHQDMGDMMHGGHAGHMMDDDDMGHGSLLSQADKLGLSTEQENKLNTLHVAEQKDLIRSSAEADVVRLELSNLLSSTNWTMKDAEPLVQKLNKIEGNMQLRHLQALHEARQILTADQLKLYSSLEKSDHGEIYCN